MGNKIIVYDGTTEEEISSSIPGLKLKFDNGSNNNTIKIPKSLKISYSSVDISGDNNQIVIGKTIGRITNFCVSFPGKKSGRTLSIGKNFDCGGLFVVLTDEDDLVTIGDDCLFSENISIRPSDGHYIYDIDTHELLNKGGSVSIGNKVWVGRNVFIGKNVVIGNGCVVGFGSVVTKAFNVEHVVLAGNPATIVKTNIEWSKNPR